MELWDIYDRQRRTTGRFHVRGTPMGRGEYHLTAFVWVFNRQRELLLTRRAPEKEHYANCWAATGGAALVGETSLQTVRRELREETGIARGTFTLIVRHVFDSGHCICYDYLCTTDCDKDGIVLQDGETEGWKWLNEAEFSAFVNSDEGIGPQKERFRPYFIEKGYLRG